MKTPVPAEPGERTERWPLPRRLPKPRPEAALWALGALAAAVLLAAVATRRPRPEFPRSEAEFLAAPARLARLAAAQEKLKADPQDIAALAESGRLHFQDGKDAYPEAINELEEALRLGSVDARLFYYLGVMYQEEALYPFAIAQFHRFLRNFPEDREARLLLGKLLFQTGSFEDAATQYRWLRDRFPKDPLVAENLGLSLMRLKRPEEAAPILESLAADPATARRAHFYLGQIAFQAKEYPKAKLQFDGVLPVDGRPDLAGLAAADIRSAIAANDEKVQAWEAAKDLWEAVLKDDPKNAQAKAALKALKPHLKKAAPPKPAATKAKRKKK